MSISFSFFFFFGKISRVCCDSYNYYSLFLNMNGLLLLQPLYCLKNFAVVEANIFIRTLNKAYRLEGGENYF